MTVWRNASWRGTKYGGKSRGLYRYGDLHYSVNSVVFQFYARIKFWKNLPVSFHTFYLVMALECPSEINSVLCCRPSCLGMLVVGHWTSYWQNVMQKFLRVKMTGISMWRSHFPRLGCRLSTLGRAPCTFCVMSGSGCNSEMKNIATRYLRIYATAE